MAERNEKDYVGYINPLTKRPAQARLSQQRPSSSGGKEKVRPSVTRDVTPLSDKPANKPTPPPIKFKKTAKPAQESKKVTVGKKGTVGGRVIEAGNQIKTELGLGMAKRSDLPKPETLRTNNPPKYASNALSKKQTNAVSEEAIEKYESEGSRLSRSHELPGGRNNPIFTNHPADKPATGAQQLHINAMRKHVNDFVSAGGKGPKAEAARAGYHTARLMAGGHGKDEGICSTTGCTRTTEKGETNCPGGSCNIVTPTKPALRNRE
jgi:hypothetical protein